MFSCLFVFCEETDNFSKDSKVWIKIRRSLLLPAPGNSCSQSENTDSLWDIISLFGGKGWTRCSLTQFCDSVFSDGWKPRH